MSGTLVGVGVGPGDPELVTVRGVNALREADVVVVPVPDTGAGGRAEATVVHYVPEEKVVRVVLALDERSGRARREAAWAAAGNRVAGLLGNRGRVAFAAVGDPHVHSAFAYLARTVAESVPGVAVETVPGITAVQEFAARSGVVAPRGPAGEVAGVSRPLPDGEEVAPRAETAWPLPPLPEAAEREVVLRPPSLVVGVGASQGAPVEEVLGLVEDTLREAGLSAASVAELATVDTKAEEPGVVEAARRLGVPLVTYSAGQLAEVEVPSPSDAPLAAVGTPSVAEAAALAGGGEILVPKRKSAASPARATCAVVRRPGVDGLRPGARPDTSRDIETAPVAITCRETVRRPQGAEPGPGPTRPAGSEAVLNVPPYHSTSAEEHL
ncbi:cobalamin biosynthesis protein [Streptomyces violaceus]|uniref:cobalamin biosynthesis protein n=1 Tax=Streptomyces violaceus TaxID=1936 RepID=UPI002E220584|nr:cobalamin biosynthesis protein [Streptomyces violaceus]